MITFSVSCFLIILGLYLTHKICLWAEDHGYLYYKRKKASNSSVGSAMLELQGILNPGANNFIEMKQNAVKHVCHEADVPGGSDKL